MKAARNARKLAQVHAERLRIALSAARAGVIDLDLEARTAWTSPEVTEIIGRPLVFADFAERPWAMCHPDDRARIDALVRRWTSGRHEPLDFRIEAAGTHRWVQVHSERLAGARGRPSRIISLIIDIDERKRQELALTAAEEAARAATEAKSQFLANMSHEIRTPMNGVLGVLHLLKQEPLTADGEKLLAEAESCGRMLSQLLDDVIDFSRIEAGRMELCPEPINAADVLESVTGVLRPHAEGKGLELRSSWRGASPWIVADPVRLRQALFNLIGNGVKFTPQGHVEARLQVLALNDSERRLRFDVEDTGVGISTAAQAGLFERFNRGDAATARRFRGSGLGLAITRRIAGMMGGDLTVSSREGVGSTFRLEIVAPVHLPSDLPATDEPSVTLEGVRILLAEDNPTNRLIARRLLEGMGASIETVEDGLEALEAVMSQRFDLVLMDIQMPRMDGLEATRRIRGLEGADGAVPIIALTADALAQQRAHYAAAGIDGMVAKPIAPSALFKEIIRVLATASERRASTVLSSSLAAG